MKTNREIISLMYSMFVKYSNRPKLYVIKKIARESEVTVSRIWHILGKKGFDNKENKDIIAYFTPKKAKESKKPEKREKIPYTSPSHAIHTPIKRAPERPAKETKEICPLLSVEEREIIERIYQNDNLNQLNSNSPFLSETEKQRASFLERISSTFNLNMSEITDCLSGIIYKCEHRGLDYFLPHFKASLKGIYKMIDGEIPEIIKFNREYLLVLCFSWETLKELKIPLYDINNDHLNEIFGKFLALTQNSMIKTNILKTNNIKK